MVPSDRDGIVADRRAAFMIAAGLVLAVFAVFGQTVWFGFAGSDDPIYVTQNPWVLAGLTPDGAAWALTAARGAVWVPLTWLSLMLDAELYGSWAGGFHLTNVLLHAACAAGLFLLLRGATSRTWPAATAAAIFALHPLRVEAVAWVTARKDVLSSLCFLLTLWAYGRYVRRPSPGRYAAVAAALTIGLMAKSMLVTTPVLLLLLDFWPLGRIRGSRDCVRLAVEKLPLATLSLAAAVITVAVQGDVMLAEPHMTVSWRLVQSTLAYVGYLGLFLWPGNLAAGYPRPGIAVPWPAVVTAAALITASTWAAWRERRRFPYLIVGWLWYLVALLPVAGVFQIGAVMMADRFTYLPLIGPVVALVWLIADAVDPHFAAGLWHTTATAIPPRSSGGRRAAAGLAAVVVAGAAILSYSQTRSWQDTETLWSRALERTTNNWFAHVGLAGALLDQGRFREADVHARRALEIAPSNLLALRERAAIALATDRPKEAMSIAMNLIRTHPRDSLGWTVVGRLLLREGRYPQALDHYQAALALAPDSIDAITGVAESLLGCGEPRRALGTMLAGHRLWPADPRIARQFGRVLLAVGKPREAAEQLRRAVDHGPGDAAAWNALGVALGQSGRIDDAIAALRKAAEIEPTACGFHRDLGFALRESRRFADAAASLRRAVDLEPGNRMAANDLAWLLATCPDPAVRSGAEAVTLAVEASRLAGDDDPTVLDTLAAAHAEAGRFAAATATARRALELAEGAGNAGLAAEVRTHLDLFAAGRPVRDPR